MNTEITQAITELKQAEQNFIYADSSFIDIAILQLDAAKMKVDMLLKIRKQNGPTAMDPCVREKSLTKLFNTSLPQQDQTVKRKILINVVNYMDGEEKQLIAIGKNF